MQEISKLQIGRFAIYIIKTTNEKIENKDRFLSHSFTMYGNNYKLNDEIKNDLKRIFKKRNWEFHIKQQGTNFYICLVPK